MVLAPKLSMCPNGKHPSMQEAYSCDDPEPMASSAFKGKKIYDRRVRSSAVRAYDTPDNPTYKTQIDSSPTGDVRQCAMYDHFIHPCTRGTLVNKWSVIQPPAVSYPPMPPFMTPLLFWNANPVMPYMYPGGVTYSATLLLTSRTAHQIPVSK